MKIPRCVPDYFSGQKIKNLFAQGAGDIFDREGYVLKGDGSHS
jgi:hypothetical protein